MMIGMTVSVIRAWVMFLFRIGADMTGRRYDMPTALSAAAVIALGINPLYLYDGGFWLSFGAVFAICVMKPNGIFVPSLAINSMLCPVILYYFYEIPGYSMLLNVIVIPLMSVLLFCGLSGSLMGIAGILPAKAVFGVCRAILCLYERCCSLTVKLPGARWVAGRPDIRRIMLYYVLLAAAIIVRLYLPLWNKKRKECMMKYGDLKGRLLGYVLYAAGIVVLVSGPMMRTGTEITMLDVGQGDCICVEGPEHQNYLIDGGSSDVKKR